MRKPIAFLLGIAVLLTGCQSSNITAPNFGEVTIKSIERDKQASYMCDLISTADLEKITGIAIESSNPSGFMNIDSCGYNGVTEGIRFLSLEFDPRKISEIKAFFESAMSNSVHLDDSPSIGDGSLLVTYDNIAGGSFYISKNGKTLRISGSPIKQPLNKDQFLEIAKIAVQKM